LALDSSGKDPSYHNLFLSYSSNFTFFSFPIKKIKNNSKKTDFLAKASWEDSKYTKNQVAILDEIWGLIVPHCSQNWRDNTNLRSN
jgi:hypothetical protein